jgi:hypothetical protein
MGNRWRRNLDDPLDACRSGGADDVLCASNVCFFELLPRTCHGNTSGNVDHGVHTYDCLGNGTLFSNVTKVFCDLEAARSTLEHGQIVATGHQQGD